MRALRWCVLLAVALASIGCGASQTTRTEFKAVGASIGATVGTNPSSPPKDKEPDK